MPDPRDATAPCPDLAELLLASEGELSKRRQSEVSAHLRLCPACREQLGSVGLALREYQDAVTETNASARAAEADASADRLEVFRDRLQDERRTQTANRVRLPFRRWLPVAAAVPVLVGALFFSNRYTSVLRAEELLTKAAAQEQTVPANTVRRLEIHIKRTGVRTTRDVGASARLVSVSENTAADVELTRRLTASHLDPQDPLSIRAFRTWHDSLRAKTDSVSPAGRDALALHTETDEGLLQSVDLIVRRIDFQPLRATFAFADLGEVEITELSRWVAPTPTVAEKTLPREERSHTSPTGRDLLDQTELDVRRALHLAGADSRHGTSIRRTTDTIEVHGRFNKMDGMQLTRALSGLGSVKLQLQPEADRDAPIDVPAAMEGKKPDTTPAVRRTSVPLQRWLNRTFGQTDRGSAFIGSLTMDVEFVRRRSEAFAALASRYPEPEIRRLSPSAHDKLDALVDSHYQDLLKSVEALDDHLSLFLGTTTRGAAADVIPRPWQVHALNILLQVNRLDEAIREMLREEDLPLPSENGHAESQALSNLRKIDEALWDQFRSAKE